MGILSPRAIWGSSAVVVAALSVTFLAIWLLRPRIEERVIRRSVISTIQSEAPASFYVTGVLQLVATSEVEDTRVLLPDLLPLNLGTTRATVRLPGSVSYGFDVSYLRPDHVQVNDDGTVNVTLPDLQVFSVEPNLNAMEIQTDVGWARTHAGSGQDATQATSSTCTVRPREISEYIFDILKEQTLVLQHLQEFNAFGHPIELDIPDHR